MGSGWAWVWLLLGVPLRAWVLTVLWAWFVVGPLGARGISMPVAYGLTMIVAMFQTHTQKGETPEDEKASRQFAVSIAIPLLALAFGAIAHAMM